jgi:hypothetical protein
MDRRLLLASLVGAPVASAGAAAIDGPAFGSLAALRTANSAEAAVLVLGYGAAGDGGGGVFLQAPGDTSADNDVTVIVDAAGKRWRRNYSGPINIRWAGGRGDGKTDDSAAIAMAAKAGPILIPGGAFRIGAAVSISSHCRIEAGGSLIVEAGTSVAFEAGFEAPLTQVFSGPGVVRFDPRFHTVGHPEWWGARGWLPHQPAPGPDCLAALTACVEACPVTELQAVDYWISSTWKVATDTRTIRGVGTNGQGPNMATRILLRSSDLDVVQIGPDRQPSGGANAFLSRAELTNVTLLRTLAPAAPASGVGGPSGLRLQFALDCRIIDVWSLESTNGFYAAGVVYSAFEGCHATRINAGTTPGNDYFAGFLLDSRPRIGMNTGLASLYIRNRCGVHAGGRASPTYGVRTIGGFTDLFIDSFECSSTQNGLYFDGESDLAFPSENLRVSNCVLDQVRTGIALLQGNATTNVTLVNNYCAPSAAAGGSIGILIRQTPKGGAGGAISLVGNELIGSGGETVGLMIDRSAGVVAAANVYTDLDRPVVLQSASNCRVTDRISNVARRAGGAAISLETCQSCVIDPMIGGAVGAFKGGVALAGGRRIEVRCSGIDGGAVAGARLTADGRAIAEAGPFAGDCLAQGLIS